MENIEKNITLECAKNRFYNNFMPAIDSETLQPISDVDCWGDFPYDVIIESGDEFDIFSLREHLPMLFDGGYYIFRFGNISNIYGWLKKFITNTVFYKLVTRKGGLRWIEYDYDFYSGDTLDIYTMPPNIDDYTSNSGYVCDLVAVNNEAETFNQLFRLSGDTTRYELKYLDFVKAIFSGTSKYRFRKPYLDLPLTISESVNTVGELLSDEQLWWPNKKYFIGDIVYHEGDYYVLDRGDGAMTVEVTGILYNVVLEDFQSNINESDKTYNYISQIPKDVNTLSREKLNVLYKYEQSLVDFKFVYVYYAGKYNDKTRITEFDDVDDEHWTKITPSSVTESGETDFLVASKLDVFRSVRKSYDIDGNLLPFNVLSDNHVALIYTFGYTNYALKDNGACADYFDKVEFLKSLTDDDPYVIEYGGPGSNRYIVTDKLPNIFRYIRFTYYSGCEVIVENEQQTIDKNTGIKYTETRPFEYVTEQVKYDSSAETEFSYLLVSTTTDETRWASDSTPRARIVYKTGTVDAIPTHVFASGKLFGSAFVEQKRDNVHISRGMYGAFERHNILGEVNSMDDLQKYRNNYFKL